MKPIAKIKKTNKMMQSSSCKGLGKKKHSQNNIRLYHEKTPPKYENLMIVVLDLLCAAMLKPTKTK